MKYLAFALFASTIPIANWLIGNIGTTCVPDGPCLIPVGFNLMAPSGVIMIGLALVLRDWLHELAGWVWSFVAIVFGVVLSFLFSPTSIALASASAFFIAETSDLFVYSKLREKSKPLAVVMSQIVGAFIDSMIFVYIAFGSFDFGTGNFLAKVYSGAFIALLMYIIAKKRVKYDPLPRDSNI